MMPKKYSCSYSLFPQLYKNGYLTLQNTLMKQQMPAKPASVVKKNRPGSKTGAVSTDHTGKSDMIIMAFTLYHFSKIKARFLWKKKLKIFFGDLQN